MAVESRLREQLGSAESVPRPGTDSYDIPSFCVTSKYHKEENKKEVFTD